MKAIPLVLPLVSLLLSGAPSGCSAPFPSASLSDRYAASPLPTPAPDVDPQRAYLSLSKIEPPVDRPIRPADLKPVSERTAQSMQTARDLLDQQRFTEASLELERALRFDPNHPDLHRTLAQLHWQAGNLERAKTHATRAIEANADDAGAHYVLGRIAAGGGDRFAAIQSFRKALTCSDFERDPDVAALIHYHLAEALSSEGYLEAGLGQYQAFEEKAGSIGSAHDSELVALMRSNRGRAGESVSKILERLGRFAEAADAMSAVLGAHPHDTGRMLRYAGLLLKADRVEEALRVARGIPGDGEEVLGLLAEIHAREGQPARIVEDLRFRRSSRPDDPRLLLKLVDKLILFDRSAEARRELRQFLETHPELHAVRLRLFDVLVADSAWKDALQLAAAGIEAQPALTGEWEAKIQSMAARPGAAEATLGESRAGESATVMYLRGLVAVSAKRPSEGEELLRQAFQRQPEMMPVRAALARLYLSSYRYSDVLTIAGRRQESAPEDARLELILGEIHERLDNVDQAALHFKAALQLSPGDTRAMFQLAQLYRRADDLLSAQRQLRLLLDKQPTHDEARETLALLYLNEGKFDAAAEQVEELKRRASSDLVRERANALLAVIRSRDTEAYRETLRRALDQHGADVATLLALAESYEEFEQESARQAYLKVLAMDPDNEMAALGLVFAEERLLEWESAAERLRRMLPRRPNRHVWRLGWSGTRWHLGLLELDIVLQDYGAALALAREQALRDDLDEAMRTRYRLAWVEALRLMGRQEEAVERIKSWAEEGSSGQNPWNLQLAREYQRQNEPAKAVPIFEAAFRKNPSERSGMGDVVEALLAADQSDRAGQYILEWLAEDPDNDDALGALVLVLSQQKRTDDALELVRNKQLHARDRQRFQNMQLFLLDAAERHGEAVELAETLIGGLNAVYRSLQEPGGRRGGRPLLPDRIERLPNEPFTPAQLQARLDFLQARLAAQLIAAKDHREAQIRIREWLEETQNPEARFSYLMALSACQREQGNEAQVGETLQLALALQPDHVGLNNDVAYTWIDQGTQLNEAEKMIRFSISRDPRRLAYLDTFGWLLYKKGQFADAKTWLLRASNAGGAKDRDPVVLDHLGDAYWRLGEADDAIRVWGEAATLIRERPAEKMNADERRVRNTIEGKIDDAREGRSPAVAALASSGDEVRTEGSQRWP